MRVEIPASEHGIAESALNQRALGIVNRLQNAGYEAYLVGGCIRDLLLGQNPKDFDIATSAKPEEVRKLFNSCRLIGRRFRLAHIYFGREYYEVATFRAPPADGDGGTTNEQGRIIHDNVYGTLEEDVLRRDFSVNALFYDPVRNVIIDFVNGVQDLKSRQLKLLGEPSKRFQEDPVRILRAIRFSAKLNLDIDPEVASLIRPMGELLTAVAPARLFDELLKLLQGGSGQTTFKLLQQYDLARQLLPQTLELIDSDQTGQFATFIDIALANTDKRIAEGMSVMPPFIFAVLFWQPYLKAKAELEASGLPPVPASIEAGEVIFKQQCKITAIPRRFSSISREIWTLQYRLGNRDAKRSNSMLGNKRFRAAYDFLCLRVSAGESTLAELADWWTEFQEADEERRSEMYIKSDRRRNKRRRKRSKH